MSCTNQMMIRRTIDGVNTFAGPFKYGLIYKNKLPSQSYYPIPCGSCEYCKLKRSKIWAARCTLESMNWPHNYFITLTYDDLHLPLVDNYDVKLGSLEKHSNLVVRHLQLFFKRLRKRGYKIKYLAAGEYGSKTKRAHYHLILFSDKPLDLKYYKLSENDFVLYNSSLLEKLWPYGFNVVAEFSPATAAYVARYTLKKQQVKKYSFLKQSYKQEFLVCSRGIGFSNVLNNLDKVVENKKLPYSFNNNVSYIPVWKSMITKMENLGFEKEAEKLKSYYRENAEVINKLNDVGFDKWLYKINNLKYLFKVKSSKLNTKL